MTLDGDLQDDPAEIPNFLARMADGFDVVSGWKKVRHDPWHKVFPSRVFNWMVRRSTGIKLHDVNCGFKAYRRKVLDNAEYPGEIRAILGEALAASVLLASCLKFDGQLTLQLRGEGPMHLLVVQCSHRREVRGLAKWRPSGRSVRL